MTRRHRGLSARLHGIGPADLAHLAGLGLLATAIEIGVRTVPLPRLAGLLGLSLGPSPRLPERSRSGRDALTPRELRRLRVARALGRRWPMGDGACLREALLVGHVLRRHDPVLRIGVVTGDRAVHAHAWVEVLGGTVGAAEGFRPLEFPSVVTTWR